MFALRYPVKWMERQTLKENICKLLDRGLVSRIFKEFSTLSSKETIQLENEQKA